MALIGLDDVGIKLFERRENRAAGRQLLMPAKQCA
jgi:hypothetical protein